MPMKPLMTLCNSTPLGMHIAKRKISNLGGLNSFFKLKKAIRLFENSQSGGYFGCLNLVLLSYIFFPVHVRYLYYCSSTLYCPQSSGGYYIFGKLHKAYSSCPHLKNIVIFFLYKRYSLPYSLLIKM